MGKLKIFKVLRKSWQLVSRAFMLYFIVVTLVEMLALVVLKEISSQALHVALSTSSIAGITNENYLVIFKHPLALILLVTIVIVSAIFILLQLTITTTYANSRYEDTKFSFASSLKSLRKIGVSQLPILFIYLFLILPNGNIGISSAITSNLHLPEFIVGYIFESPLLTVLYLAGLLTAFYLNIRFFYAFTIFSQEEVTFMEALKQSWQITKKNKLKQLGLIIVLSVVTFFGILLISGSLYGLYLLVVAKFPVSAPYANAFLQTVFLFVMAYFLAFMKMTLIQSTVVSYHMVIGNHVEVTKAKKTKWKYQKYINSLLAITFIFLTIFVYFDVPDHRDLDEKFIVSHRGESTLAIENTLRSLELANVYQPDFVEMDIQQTKDHEIIVYHDFNLKRLAGDKRRINEVKWSELKDISISTYDHEDTIPLFSDYLALAAKIKQPLMVEIKTTSNDSDDFLDKMMDQIKRAGMEEMVVFQTLDLEAALTMKEKYPQTIVGYILGFNLGGLENLKVDFYSIEASSVTNRVRREASFYQKGLFVWSVNDSDAMRHYLRLNITGIITDDPELANSVVKELKEQKLSDIFWSLNFDFI